MSRYSLLIFCLSLVCFNTQQVEAQSKSKTLSKSKADSEEITLERLFPKDSFFGPSARSTDFSLDGRYAAYLYRPYDERRHGNDLWVYDFKTRKNTRIINLAMMAQFQSSARVVKQDRLAKHKSKDSKDKDDEKDSKDKKKNDKDRDEEESGEDSEEDDEDREKTAEEIEAENKIVNSVSEEDADDKYAPRYGGISGFKWHPTDNSMLVFSEGDIYHIVDIAKPELKRLTKTSSSESQVDFLPDGSGYTYNVDNAVYRLRFDSHLVEQLNPSLESGRELSNYSISPDGKKLVLVARTEGGFFSSGGRKVDIIRYRDRFAKADSISRTVSDDEVKPQDVYVYLFDLEKIGWEESELLQVFHKQIDDPRDVISRPKWSLDSEKITFCFFNQKDDVVEIRVGEFPEQKEYKKLLAAAEKKADSKRKEKAAEAKKEDEEKNRRPRPPGPSRTPLTVEFDSETVYEFKHDGGPNTPRMVSPNWAADSKHVIFISELSGFRHVHVLDTLYQSVRQLTSGHYEVYPLDFSEDHKTMFVTATKDSPAQTMVYSIDIESGKMERLSNQDGVYRSVAVSDDGKRLMANYATYGKLTELVGQNGNKTKVITDSHPEEAFKLTKWMPEFFEYENREGHTIHGTMIKPDGWKAKSKKKYPLLIYVYGGPLGTSKSVVDASYRSESYFFGGYTPNLTCFTLAWPAPVRRSGRITTLGIPRERLGHPRKDLLTRRSIRFARWQKISRANCYSCTGWKTPMCCFRTPWPSIANS